MVLVNGTKGIGTGWSTDIPQYNPLDLINIIKKMIKNEEVEDNLVPWYRNYLGSFHKTSEKSFINKGYMKL